jgi:hypothetical protein
VSQVQTDRGSGVNTMTRETKKPRGQIECPTRGIYVGSPYAECTGDWPPLFSGLLSEDRIIRFDDTQTV